MARSIAIVLAVLFAGPRTQAAEGQHVLIGATLPLTGADAAPARAFRMGYELAVEEINARGGVLVDGRQERVSLVVRDDAGKPERAAAELGQLIEGVKVTALLGSYGTPLIRAQAPVAEGHKLPYVNGGSNASELYQQNMGYLFGTLSPVKMLGFAEVGWIEQQQKEGLLPKPVRIAMLWENTAHGRDFRKAILSLTGRAAGVGVHDIVLDAPFELNTPDFRPVLARVNATAADVFLVDANLSDFITLHREYLAEGLCHRVVSYGARGAEKTAADALGRDHLANLVSAAWWSPKLEGDARNRTFIEGFQRRYGQEPDAYSALSYETARALLSAIDHAQSVRPEKIRSALETLHMESLLPGGQINFPAAYGNQAHYPLVVLQNQADGTAPIVFPSHLATRRGVIAGACPRALTEAVSPSPAAISARTR
ncbi:MAG: ABC transporter substrate-binding protein [Myxococcales bacterium]